MTEEFLFRLILASLLGGVIGLERQIRAKEAGVRTHILIGIGSAMFMIVSKYGFYDVIEHTHIGLDPSRIAAQVVTGVDFRRKYSGTKTNHQRINNSRGCVGHRGNRPGYRQWNV
jgi:uncharacterized membrane protein YhiD involved in acid resistance